MNRTEITIEVGEKIGSILKKLRKERKWSVATVADKAEVSTNTYERFEDGVELKLATERKILDAFQIQHVTDAGKAGILPSIVWKEAQPRPPQ